MVGMILEEALDLPPVILQLAFQGVEQLEQGQRQSALGPDDRWTAAKLMGLGKELQPLFIELGAVETVNVQELFPFPAASLLEQVRRGKLLHETPGRQRRPIIK